MNTVIYRFLTFLTVIATIWTMGVFLYSEGSMGLREAGIWIGGFAILIPLTSVANKLQTIIELSQEK